MSIQKPHHFLRPANAAGLPLINAIDDPLCFRSRKYCWCVNQFKNVVRKVSFFFWGGDNISVILVQLRSLKLH